MTDVVGGEMVGVGGEMLQSPTLGILISKGISMGTPQIYYGNKCAKHGFRVR